MRRPTGPTLGFMATASKLGDYLRARREQVRPEDVGLPAGERRRVPGLRREEVALLAGISAEYYLRLEQGRDRHPSDQVLDSIAGALRLETDARVYMHALAHSPRTATRRTSRPERVSASIQNMIDGWPTTPALVHGRYMTTLAANPMAIALNPSSRRGSTHCEPRSSNRKCASSTGTGTR